MDKRYETPEEALYRPRRHLVVSPFSFYIVDENFLTLLLLICSIFVTITHYFTYFKNYLLQNTIIDRTSVYLYYITTSNQLYS